MADETRHVLFVDDDAEIIEMVEALLEPRGVNVTTAPDGVEALVLLESGLRPDIIIADVTMPNMDGFDLFRAVRDNDTWKDIPFVLVTGNDDRANLSRALMLGSDDYLIKPFDPERLLLTVYGKTRRSNVPARQLQMETGPATPNTNGRRDVSARRAVAPHEAPTLPSRHALRQQAASTPGSQGTNDLGNELKGYLGVLWRYKWIIVVCTVVAASVALALSFLMTPIYAATSTVRVSVASGGVVDWGANALAARLVNTYVEIATGDRLREQVMNELGLEREPGVEVEPVPETELLRITATDPDPAAAQAVANLLARMMIENSLEFYGGDAPTARELLEIQLEEAQTNLDNAVAAYDTALRSSRVETVDVQGTPVPEGYLDYLQAQVTLRQQIYADVLERYENARYNESLRANAITIVEEAYLPTSPASPKKALNLLFGLVGGLGVGAVLAFLLETLDTSIRNTEEVQTTVPLPLLGQIPEAPHGLPFRPAPSPLFPESGYPFLADVYHRLRAHLMMSGAIPPGSASVLITSPEPGTGKSTVTANLGLALAQSGSRVILVDMDLRRPSLHRIFNLSKEPGLSDVLRGETTLNEVLQEGSHKNLRILTAGRVTDDLTGLLTPTQTGAFIESLLEDCDYVLLDAPAVLATADATLLAGQADTILVLAAQRRTDRTNLRQSLQHLHQIGAKVAGVIVNRVPRSRLYAYYSQPSTPVEIIKDRIRRIRTGVK